MTSSLASPLTLPFGFTREVPRRVYVAWGVLLFLLRYAVEAAVVDAFTGRSLDPLTFLTPYFGRPSSLTIEAGPVGVALLLSAVPFLWVAVSMSVRRAAAAGMPEAFGFLVLVPGVHYAIIATLAALPDKRGISRSPRATGPFREPEPAVDEPLAPGLAPDRLFPAMVMGFMAAVACAPFFAGTERPWVWLFLFGPGLAAFVAARHYRALMPRPAEEEREAKPAPKPAPPARTGSEPLVGGATGFVAGLVLVIILVLAGLLLGGWSALLAWAAILYSPIICLLGAGIGATSSLLGSRAGVSDSHGLGAVLALALPVGLVAALYFDGPAVLLGSVFAIIAAIIAIVVKAVTQPWDR